MIKAVFLDWFNTLAQYSPPREELQSKVLGEFGINVSPDKILPAILIADKNLFDEHASSPVTKRSPEEQAKIYALYQQTVLTEAGVDISDSPALLPKVMKRAQELYRDIQFVLFDDVIPAVKTLKERGLTLGLVTNMEMEMRPLCKELGLGPYLNFVVTSSEVGSDKPQPRIFLEALKRAGAEAREVLHVGDQYKIDVDGARGAGINPLLLDRFNQYPEVDDCPRIHSLSEVVEHLQ